MDAEEANKFINSLVKSLQVLCHGHVHFNSSIQVIGHLYLNVDSNVNIDYIVNEKVCKSDTSSTIFVSKSYHSEPHKREEKTAPVKHMSHNGQSQNERLCDPSQDNIIRERGDILAMNYHRRPHKRAETQFNVQPPQKVSKKSYPSQSHVSPLRPSVQNSDYSMDIADHDNQQPIMSSPSVMLRSDREPPPNEKPFQVLPLPPDLDLKTIIKSEPADPSDDDAGDGNLFQEHDHVQGTSSVTSGEQMDDMCSDEFLIGLRDKTLGLYPVAMHPNEQNTSSAFNLSANSSHSFSQSSSEPVAGSSNSASFYNPKNIQGVNSDPKKVPCPLCGLVVLRQRSLKRHMLTKHMNERVFCTKCRKSFTQMCNLRRHQKNICGKKQEFDTVIKISDI